MFEMSVAPLKVPFLAFPSAAAAMAYLSKEQPGLLVLDILMPGKDGLTFLQELRDNPLHGDTRVVIISSKDYAQDRRIATELGALDFVTKPIGTQAIQELVRRHLQA
jgi:DNA-binding response OmpR family regulator